MAKRGRTLKTAFFDSSVLFSAVYSPTGGSSKLFTIKDLNLTTSRIVLAGVERNVRNKLESYHLGRFFRLVEKLKNYGVDKITIQTGGTLNAEFVRQQLRGLSGLIILLFVL